MVVGKIKTLILGAGGMLGMDLQAVFPEAISLTHAELDITDKNAVFSIIDRLRPELVINDGASKLEGERAIVNAMNRYYIVRTSWLFGLHGANLVNTMLKLGTANHVVRVVNDQFGKPTYTKDLAQKIPEILDCDYGIYHITNEGVCSWYEFASAIIPNAVPCTSKEYIRRAKRPEYSVLVNTKTRPMRHWKDALVEYMEVRKT